MISPGEVAVLNLAAGTSSRMGTFKPLIPMGGLPLIERIVGNYRAAGIEGIMTVVGHRADRLIPVLEGLGVGWTMNPEYLEEMFTSIKTGLEKLHPHLKAFYLQPGDMPFVRSETIGELLASFDPERMDILRPRHAGRRGHPVLISASGIPSIQAYDGPGGLRGLVESGDWRAHDLDIRDPGILIDLDTPEDLEAASKLLGKT